MVLDIRHGISRLYTAKEQLDQHLQLDASVHDSFGVFIQAVHEWTDSSDNHGGFKLKVIKLAAKDLRTKIGEPTSPKSGGATDVLSTLKAAAVVDDDGNGKPRATPKSKKQKKDADSTLVIKTPENHDLNTFRKNVDEWVKEVLAFSPKDDTEHKTAKDATKKQIEELRK